MSREKKITDDIVDTLIEKLAAMGSTLWTQWEAEAKKSEFYTSACFERSASPNYWTDCFKFFGDKITAGTEEAELVTAFMGAFSKPGGRLEVARCYQAHLQCKHNQNEAFAKVEDCASLDDETVQHACDYGDRQRGLQLSSISFFSSPMRNEQN